MELLPEALRPAPSEFVHAPLNFVRPVYWAKRHGFRVARPLPAVVLPFSVGVRSHEAAGSAPSTHARHR